MSAITHGDQQGAIGHERQAGAEVHAGILVRFGAEDLLDAVEAVIDKAAAHHPGAIDLGGAGGERQVDQAVVGKIGMQYHIGEPALAAAEQIVDLGHWLGQQLAIPDQAQGPGFFRHQQVATGQEGDAVGLAQAAHQGFDLVVGGGGVETPGGEGQDCRHQPATAARKTGDHRSLSMQSANRAPPQAPASIWPARPAAPRVPAYSVIPKNTALIRLSIAPIITAAASG